MSFRTKSTEAMAGDGWKVGAIDPAPRVLPPVILLRVWVEAGGGVCPQGQDHKLENSEIRSLLRVTCCLGSRLKFSSGQYAFCEGHVSEVALFSSKLIMLFL